MIELVNEIVAGGQKAIIFSNWESMTEVAREKLKSYNPAYITGATKADERMKEVERFQNDDKCKVIIGTTGVWNNGSGHRYRNLYGQRRTDFGEAD